MVEYEHKPPVGYSFLFGMILMWLDGRELCFIGFLSYHRIPLFLYIICNVHGALWLRFQASHLFSHVHLYRFLNTYEWLGGYLRKR